MEKQLSEMKISEIISATISKAREGQPTRENALVITKLQEAMMWQTEYERELLAAARRSGVGMSVRQGGQSLGNFTLTEPIEGQADESKI